MRHICETHLQLFFPFPFFVPTTPFSFFAPTNFYIHVRTNCSSQVRDASKRSTVVTTFKRKQDIGSPCANPVRCVKGPLLRKNNALPRSYLTVD